MGRSLKFTPLQTGYDVPVGLLLSTFKTEPEASLGGAAEDKTDFHVRGSVATSLWLRSPSHPVRDGIAGDESGTSATLSPAGRQESTAAADALVAGRRGHVTLECRTNDEQRRAVHHLLVRELTNRQRGSWRPRRPLLWHANVTGQPHAN